MKRLSVLSSVMIATVFFASITAFGQTNSESKLFTIAPEMCSWPWLSSQGHMRGASAGGAVVADALGNIEMTITFLAGVYTEEQRNEHGKIWQYKYIFLNCSSGPVVFFTSPGFPSGTFPGLEQAYGRITSAPWLTAMQGLQLVFYDTRPPVANHNRTIGFLSPATGTRLSTLPFPMWLYEPDPTLPKPSPFDRP